MGHGTSSLLTPTSGVTTQAELVGIAGGSGIQDLKVRALGLNTNAVANQVITVSDVTTTDYILRVMGAAAAEMMNIKADGSIRLGYTATQIQSFTSGAGSAAGSITAFNYNQTPSADGGSGDGEYQAYVADTRAWVDAPTAQTRGGGLAFLVWHGAAIQIQHSAIVYAVKESSVADQVGAALCFATTTGGGAVSTERMRLLSLTSTLQGRSDFVYAWTSGAANAAATTGLSRTASGVVAVGNGSQGDFTGVAVATEFRNHTTQASASFSTSGGDLFLGSAKAIKLSSTTGITGTIDAGLSRGGVGVVKVGNGNANDATGTLVAALHQDASTNLRNVSATIAQAATDGFLFAPSCLTGAPSGAPTLGNGALVVGGDNHLYVRLNGVWTKLDAQSAGATPTLSAVLSAGNTTAGGGQLLQISTGDSINYLSGSSTSTTNNIRWPTGIWIGGDGSNNLVLNAGSNIKFVTGSGTGSGTASLGTNCPATTLTAPFTWLTFIGPAGDTLRVPAWK